MITVPNFVSSYLEQARLIGLTPTKLIAAENYPPGYGDLSTYFYRSIKPEFRANLKAPKFFKNVMESLGIKGDSEFDQLNNFLHQGYRLIDCYNHNRIMYPPKSIVDDINTLGSNRIIFLTERNVAAIQAIAEIPDVAQKIVPDFRRGEIWFPFPNYPSQELAFKESIQFAISHKLF
jgi:hypothetical protein